MTRAAKSPVPPVESNIKETIESILIAFVLAFIFRAFVVEAFVIPTGSMAPTLMGAHMRFTCPDCGYHFTVNYPTKTESDDSLIVPTRARLARSGEDQVFSIYCPNCGFKLQRHDPEDADNSVTAPPVRFGDRILVLKYMYLFQDPRRWDVVVFKAPPYPLEDDYSVNYIKRLTGKPGESIMILDGDIYVADPGSKGDRPEDFKVQTKPRTIQDALWRVVYDNDFHPRGLSRDQRNEADEITRPGQSWIQPWQVEPNGTGWELAAKTSNAGRVFEFNAPTGGGAIAFNPDANQYSLPFTDWLAYDQIGEAERTMSDNFNSPPWSPQNRVSDLKLAFSYQRHSGDGPLTAEMSKLDRTFVAQIEGNRVSLLSRTDAENTVLGTANVSLGSGVHRIEFQNVDYQVTLRVDGEDLIQTTPAQYAPNINQLLEDYRRNTRMARPTVRISASGQVSTLSHLSLMRDAYYGNRGYQNYSATKPFHGSPADFPNNIMHLGKDEFFVLGDNSPISGDARYWPDKINLPNEDLFVDSGRVPGRFLLGKAFFVYWPAGYRPVDSAPALVPNFGDMRLIH